MTEAVPDAGANAAAATAPRSPQDVAEVRVCTHDNPEKKPPPRAMEYGLTVDEIPQWLHTPFIITGYRYGGDYGQALRSVFRWHNEVANIWSMIVIFIMSSIWLAYNLAHYRPEPVDTLGFLFLFCRSALHLPFTVGYHTFLPISSRTFDLWRKLDLCFIFVGTTSLALALSWFAVPWWGTLAVGGASCAVLAFASAKFSTIKEGETPNRPLSSALVAASACVFFVPVFYAAIRDIVQHRRFSAAVLAMSAHPVAMLTSGVVYGTHFPEKQFPCKLFDHLVSDRPLCTLLCAFAHNELCTCGPLGDVCQRHSVFSS